MKTLSKLFVLAFLIFTISSPAIGYALSHISVQNGVLNLSLTLPPVVPNSTIPVLFRDDFDGDKLSTKWSVEQLDNAVTAYIPFSPPAGAFDVQIRVKSNQLAYFALALSPLDPPINGVSTFQIEMNNGTMDMLGVSTGDNWGHCFAGTWPSYGQGVMSDSFYGPVELDTWYVLEIIARQDPELFTFNVYSDDGILLGSTQSGTVLVKGVEMPNISGMRYQAIKHVVLEISGSQANYTIDWIKVTG